MRVLIVSSALGVVSGTAQPWRDPAWVVGVLGFLFVGAMVRGQAIYWLSRVVAERTLAAGEPPRAGWRHRVWAWLHSDGVTRGRVALARWGWPLVPVAYLTVGFQSLVMAAAGAVRMPWRVFTLAQVPGALAWAAIYSTVGFALWGAALSALAGNPWWLVGLLALLAVLALALRRRARHTIAVTGPEES